MNSDGFRPIHLCCRGDALWSSEHANCQATVTERKRRQDALPQQRRVGTPEVTATSMPPTAQAARHARLSTSTITPDVQPGIIRRQSNIPKRRLTCKGDPAVAMPNLARLPEAPLRLDRRWYAFDTVRRIAPTSFKSERTFLRINLVQFATTRHAKHDR